MTSRRRDKARIPRRHPSFRTQLLHAAPVIVVITILTAVADRKWHAFDSLQFFAVDAFGAASAPESRDVTIVAISDEDYKSTFKGRSPLDTSELERLIDAVIAKSPAVIGVDISTADAADAALVQYFAHSPTAIVWVRDAFPAYGTGSRTGTWQLDTVLGAADPPTGAAVGLSVFPLDADHLVRGYYRRISLRTPGGTVVLPSLASKIVETYCDISTRPDCEKVRRRSRDESGATEYPPLHFNFAADRYTFRQIPASSVGAAPPDLLKGSIVLIGGTFAAGRDFYNSPLGQLSGVELTALAVESELRGGGIRNTNEVLMVVMDLLAGVMLVWLSCRWAPGSRANALLSSAAILLGALVASYVAFRGFGYWATFVPVGVSVWLHQLHESAREGRAVRKELEECRKRLGVD